MHVAYPAVKVCGDPSSVWIAIDDEFDIVQLASEVRGVPVE